MGRRAQRKRARKYDEKKQRKATRLIRAIALRERMYNSSRVPKQRVWPDET